MKKYLLFTFCIAGLISYAQSGSLDLSFGSGGKVTTAIGNSSDAGLSIALQSDGKMVMAGYSLTGSKYDFSLVRYNNDGSLDNAFGAGGKVITVFANSNDCGNFVAIQSDGKIVVVGSSRNFDWDFALVRYNSDGSLDNAFGSGGKVTTDFGGYDVGISAALQSDGKIVLTGWSYVGFDVDFALVRYNIDGSLDNTFGTGGKATTDLGSLHDYGRSVVIQNDGKIVVAGTSSYDFALIRYNSNGSLDSTFDLDGKVITDLGNYSSDDAYSAALQSDGKIVVAGRSGVYPNYNYDFALVRYNRDGSLDSTFGSGGKTTTDFGGFNDYGNSVTIQGDDKIIVGGKNYNGSGSDFALARYNRNGSLDKTFGLLGKVTTDFGSSGDGGISVAIQNDNNIVLAGITGNGAAYNFAVARYIGCSAISSTLTKTPCESSALGLEENTEMSDVSIYPNPSTGVFNVQSSQKISVMEIYNALGEKKFSQKFTNEIFEFDLSKQPNGIYFAHIVSDKGTEVKKIIIQK